jgi:formate dehydrogenase (NADP+) alpha subunit
MATQTQAPAVTTVTLTIDEQQVVVPRGTLLIEAAKTVGIDIPFLCYYHKLTPFGGCRMCLVEVEKVPKLLAACNTPAAEGMIVRTTTPKVKAHRKGTLEFILINHPLDCPVCDKGGECELQDRVFEHGQGQSRLTEPKIHIEDYDLGPLVVRNQDRCIICKRCVKVMEEIVGDPVLEFGQRGVTTEVYTFEHEPFPAGFSGNTIRVCPVGALMSKPFRFKARPWELIKTPSVCSLCSVGCNLREDVRENRLLRVIGMDNPAVNDGWLCDRGQFGYDYMNSVDRLRTPLVRSASGELEPASWTEALKRAADGLMKVKQQHGAPAIGGIGSEVVSNEDSFAFQKFMREVVGTPHVDHRMGSRRTSYMALRPGAGAIEALPKAGVVLLFGSDLTAEAPVLDLVLKKSLLSRKSKLIVAHPRAIALSKFASPWLQYRPGTELFLLNGLLKAMLDGGTVAEGLAESHRAEHDALVRSLAQFTVADAAAATGVAEAAIRGAAQTYASAGLASIVFGRAPADGPEGASVLAALANLAALSGHGAKANAVLLEAVEHCNTWGARDMGVLPESGPGYGTAAKGMSTGEMVDAAVGGKLKALYVMGNNVLMRYPDAAQARRALEAVEFLVVHDGDGPTRRRRLPGANGCGKERDADERGGPCPARGARDGSLWRKPDGLADSRRPLCGDEPAAGLCLTRRGHRRHPPGAGGQSPVSGRRERACDRTTAYQRGDARGATG